MRQERSITQDLALYYRNALFVITGAIPYYAFGGIPLTLLVIHFCGVEPRVESPCGAVVIAFLIVSVLGIPVAFAQFYSTGKWIWIDLLHVFTEEAS